MVCLGLDRECTFSTCQPPHLWWFPPLRMAQTYHRMQFLLARCPFCRVLGCLGLRLLSLTRSPTWVKNELCLTCHPGPLGVPVGVCLARFEAHFVWAVCDHPSIPNGLRIEPFGDPSKGGKGAKIVGFQLCPGAHGGAHACSEPILWSFWTVWTLCVSHKHSGQNAPKKVPQGPRVRQKDRQGKGPGTIPKPTPKYL